MTYEEQKSSERGKVKCRDFLFFARDGVFCDLFHYRSTKNNLFVLYNKKSLNKHEETREKILKRNTRTALGELMNCKMNFHHIPLPNIC